MISESKISVIQYDTILEAAGISFERVGMYLLSPNIPLMSGWILHVSLVEPQIAEGIRRIIPVMKREGTWWKIIRDSSAAKQMLDGGQGKELIGKVLSIYVAAKNLLPVASELIQLTDGLMGPFVPTDAHLGNCVYTRYGGFIAQMGVDPAGKTFSVRMNEVGKWEKDLKEIPFSIPSGVGWPFLQQSSIYIENFIPAGYRLVKILSDNAKGNVLLLSHAKNGSGQQLVVQKEGKRHMWYDENGRDMTDRIRAQIKIHKKISGFCSVPELLEVYNKNGHEYLLIKYIEGTSLRKRITEIHRSGTIWKELSDMVKYEMWNYIRNIAVQLKKLHEKGFLHRDIAPDNFLIDTSGKIWFVDFEMQEIEHSETANNFKIGTEGFASPALMAGEKPTKEDDIYALGIATLNIITGIHPTELPIHELNGVKNILTLCQVNAAERDFVLNMLDERSVKRHDYFRQFADGLIRINSAIIDNDVDNSVSRLPLDDNSTQLAHFIQLAIDGMARPPYRLKDGVWQYYSSSTGNLISVRTRFYDGIASTLFFLGEVDKMGFSIAEAKLPAGKSRDFLLERLNQTLANEPPGLFTGLAGYGYALANLPKEFTDHDSDNALKAIFSSVDLQVSTLDIGSGISGIGLACIFVGEKGVSDAAERVPLIDAEIWNRRIENIIQENRSHENPAALDFYSGVTGLLLFQLSVLDIFPDPFKTVLLRQRFATWLKVYKNYLERVTNDGLFNVEDRKMIERILWGGIVSLQYYQINRDEEIVKAAETAAQLFPSEIIIGNLSFENGLSLLGHFYLDLWHATNNVKYQRRSRWIANLMWRMARWQGCVPYWARNNYTPSPDLMNGTSGLLLFLMRYYKKGIGCIPLTIRDYTRSYRISRITGDMGERQAES